MDNLERVSDVVRRRLESSSSALQTLSKRGWFLIRTHLAFRSNAFGFSFEHIWLFVWTGLASRSNTCGFSFEQVSHNGRTRPGCGANAFIRGANAYGQKTSYTLCLTDTVHVYDVPASLDLIILSFSSIVNTAFLRLNSPTFFALWWNFILSTMWLLHMRNHNRVFR